VFRPLRLAGLAVFLLAVFLAVPLAIKAAGRTDFYYTLSSVALLAIASSGVWLMFYIGRINIGQGAFALMGGYVSAILVTSAGVSFWLSLPLAGLFCTAVSILVGLPILFGVMAFAWPGLTLVSLVLLFGAWALHVGRQFPVDDALQAKQIGTC